MKILHSVELEDGSYKYQGELSGKELDFIVEVGINTLLAQGAFPFIASDRLMVDGVALDEPDMEQ